MMPTKWTVRSILAGLVIIAFQIQYSSQTSVRGVVVDKADQTPLEFVNVSVSGTTRGTSTLADGVFEITIQSPDEQLIFSFIGYKDVRIRPGNTTYLTVEMESISQTIDDIVIIAYGQVKKSDLTGSVSTISSNEIAQVAPISLDQALQARAAGVQVTQVSGRPGGETSIRIRGAGSINAGNEPLYVIDGMIITTDNNEVNAGGVAASPLNALAALNPSDIASIEILKDASATALYGSRGSNGVVLITTKRGKAGVSTVTFDAYVGVQQVAKKLDMLNGEEFSHYINAYNRNAGFPSDPRYIVPERYGEGTNWQDAIFQDAIMHNYQLNFNGGSEKTNYSVSGGYTFQDGIIINSDFERYNFRINLDQTVSDRVKVGTSNSLSYIESRGVLTGALSPGTAVLLPGATASALFFPPTLPVLDDRVRGGYTFEDDRGRNIGNPVADALETDNISTNFRAVSSAYLTFNLAEGLNFKANLGADIFSVKENRYVPNFLKRTEANNGEAVLATVSGISWLAEYTLTYDKAIGDRHQFNALIGNTYQGFQSERLFVVALDFPDNRSRYHNLANSLNPQPPANGETNWGIISYLGRINYSLDNKYLFTITGRLDGSSKFGANNKYGFFPSGAFAWKMHEEEFIKNLDAFTSLKMRVSYGTVGNQEIPPFTSLATVGPIGEGVFNNTEIYKGQEPLRFPNPSLRWERTNQLDIGFDMEFWNGRLGVVFDYYDMRTSDLLLFTPLPNTTGFTGYLSNIGGLRNHGLELAIHSRNIVRQNFSWETQFNISRNRNMITSLSTDDDIPVGGVLSLPAGWSLLRVGQPLGTFFGYQTDGIFQSDEEAASSAKLRGQNARAGDRKYRDLNGRDINGNLVAGPDGFIDEADRSIIGDANPDFIWGMSNQITYKGFELNIFLQAVHGNDIVNAYLFEIGSLDGETNVLREFWENRWTPENPNNEYTRENPRERNIFSDAQVEDGSFIRIRNVTLGYRFQNLKSTFKGLRLYVTANNLHTFTKYRGYDPEVFAFGQNNLLQGVDYGGYPLPRSLIFGLQMTL